MPRIRMEFSKGEQVRFLSHLDMMKVLDRAVRRAGIPISFSEGFNPHPKMSFASALPVGVTSEREYIDINLGKDMHADEAAAGLAGVLPEGITISGAKVVPDKSPSLMAVVNRAEYRVTVTREGALDNEALSSGITGLLDCPEIMIMKRTKKGQQLKNIRPGIKEFTGQVIGDRVQFSILTVTGSAGNVRPEEVVEALARHLGEGIDIELPQIIRLGLYIEQDGRLFTPMDIN